MTEVSVETCFVNLRVLSFSLEENFKIMLKVTLSLMIPKFKMLVLLPDHLTFLFIKLINL